MKKIALMFDMVLGRIVVDQVKSYGIEDSVNKLTQRMASVEQDVSILVSGGEPVRGVFNLGEWSHSDIVEFAGWTA